MRVAKLLFAVLVDEVPLLPHHQKLAAALLVEDDHFFAHVDLPERATDIECRIYAWSGRSRQARPAREPQRESERMPELLKRCVVTGGAGFIGSNIAALLDARGHDVTVLDNLSSGFLQNIPSSARVRVVRGDIRTYKIHLGSGNILMEPNDQYLCIVPSRRGGGVGKDKLFVPFEGDQTLAIILSKAFLLAEDKKITDPSITRQLKR